jgi:hypothetical protein
MSTDERRRTPRYKLKIPLAIRPVGEPGAPKRRVESSDVSERGIYFVSDLPFEVGTELQIVLRMPEEVTGKSSAEWNCRGLVVRIERTPESGGIAGIGVEIQSYEAAEPFKSSALNGPYREAAFGLDIP